MTTEERNQKILEDYQAGKTLRELAAEHNLTWQRISQLLHRMGEFSGESRRGKNPKLLAAAREKKEAKQAKSIARKQIVNDRLMFMSSVWKSGKSPKEMAEAIGVSRVSFIYTYAYRYRQQYPDLFPLRRDLETPDAT